MRYKRKNIKSLRLATKIICLTPNQHFCETDKAYEIWQDNPLRHIKRINKRNVFFVKEDK